MKLKGVGSMKKLLAILLVIGVLSVGFLTGCGQKEQTLKVSATSVPHAEMLEYIKDDLAEQGINLEIIVTDDYPIHNRSLAEKETDANFFQHMPYLEAQIKEFGYEIESIGKVHIEPMGLYSNTIKSLDELKENAVIAVPNDPSNEARALALLHRNGVIKLDDVENMEATVLNIVENPKNIQIQEVAAEMLPRTLEDVDAAVINTNYALQAGLNPTKDAIIIEDADSPYANIVAARKGEGDREDLKALVKALTSEKMKKFIEEHYGGSIVPAF